MNVAKAFVGSKLVLEHGGAVTKDEAVQHAEFLFERALKLDEHLEAILVVSVSNFCGISTIRTAGGFDESVILMLISLPTVLEFLITYCCSFTSVML
jgi:hypothetical protein